MTDPVLYEERDDIAIITINRPEKKNTLTDAVIQGIADGIDAATKSADVVAVVLRGAGDTLTAGYDLTAGSPAGGGVGTAGGTDGSASALCGTGGGGAGGGVSMSLLL